MNSQTYSKTIRVVGKPIENLCAQEYEDPRDALYLNAMRSIVGFDKLAKLAIEYGIERAMTIEYTGSNVRVTKHNMPYIYNCVEAACRILNVEKMPDVYIQEDPYINAFTLGSEHPILVINNSILHRLTHEELMFLIGHEIGHIKSGHCQYSLYGQVIQGVLNQAVSGIPYVSDIMPTALYLAFMEWNRMTEFTSDHAGLLVCQDLPSSISCLAKMSGYPLEFYGCLDPNDFLAQAMEFEDLDEKLYDKALKFMSTAEQSHPWCVLRAKELYMWVDSGAYARIMLRNSQWLFDEISRLSKKTNKAIEKKDKKKLKAAGALIQLQDTKRTLSLHQSEHEDAVGHKKMIAAAQEGILVVQTMLGEGDLKRQNNALDASDEAFVEAATKEKELRQIYKEADLSEIEALTVGVLGELKCKRNPSGTFTLETESPQDSNSSDEIAQKDNLLAQAGEVVTDTVAKAGAVVDDIIAGFANKK